MVFCKPALPITEQIKLLIGRGMIIEDQEKAAHHLAHMNYYRLRAYWLPFEETNSNGDHRFVPGVKWEDIEYLYEFDAKLRLLLLEAIGQVEVSLRTHWAYHLSLKYGSHAHEISDVFWNLDAHAHNLNKLQAEYLKSVETFAKHYRNHYTELSLPPIWATCELMTLGELSRWYKNLKYADDRNAIVKEYGFDETIMVPFFHHLTVVRNICAHHGRIWNRSFPFSMRIPRRIAVLFNRQNSSKIFNTITMLALLTEIINSNSNWSSRLFRLIKNHPGIDLNQMGFPQNWETLSPWKRQYERMIYVSEQLLNKILDKLDSLNGRLTNLEGQMSETNEIVKALPHQNEVLSAEVSGLKITTANAESIERIENKIDILSHRILAQDEEI